MIVKMPFISAFAISSTVSDCSLICDKKHEPGGSFINPYRVSLLKEVNSFVLGGP